MQSFNKDMVLNRLNQIDQEDLLNYLKEGLLTLEEIQDRIATAKYQLLRETYEKYRKEQADMLRFREAEERRQQERQNHLARILARDPVYNEAKIRELIFSGELQREDLTSNTSLTDHDIEKILTNVVIDTGFDEWKDLPPLPPNRTDVYVFGIAGSGKSCLLAGVLHYGDKVGAIGLETQYVAPVGVKYKDELIRRVSLGMVPQSTRADVLNYIPVPFHDERNVPHPISFIEMSGEKFTQTYKDAAVGDGIGARNYLRNNNQKIIIFVVDYQANRTGIENAQIATQSAQLEMTLTLLSNDGTFDKTHAVFVVVTKCDLLPDQSNIENDVMHFINTEYRSFLNNCKRMRDKHRFNLVIHPFSLGKFRLEQTYDHDPRFSKNIFEDLISFSFYESGNKKKGFWPF